MECAMISQSCECDLQNTHMSTWLRRVYLKNIRYLLAPLSLYRIFPVIHRQVELFR